MGACGPAVKTSLGFTCREQRQPSRTQPLCGRQPVDARTSGARRGGGHGGRQEGLGHVERQRQAQRALAHGRHKHVGDALAQARLLKALRRQRARRPRRRCGVRLVSAGSPCAADRRLLLWPRAKHPGATALAGLATADATTGASLTPARRPARCHVARALQVVSRSHAACRPAGPPARPYSSHLGEEKGNDDEPVAHARGHEGPPAQRTRVHAHGAHREPVCSPDDFVGHGAERLRPTIKHARTTWRVRGPHHQAAPCSLAASPPPASRTPLQRCRSAQAPHACLQTPPSRQPARAADDDLAGHCACRSRLPWRLLSAKPVCTCAKVSVLVASVAVTAMKAQAPTGRGSSTRPRMVVAKMLSRVQPCRHAEVCCAHVHGAAM